MAYNFFALMSRMKYIDRWALMRNSRQETLSEHSHEVAMIAHALCVIGNVRYGRKLDPDRAALIGLYHDASEIITGDMPTPVKYSGSRIQEAYKALEAGAEDHLLELLPEDLKAAYKDILSKPQDLDENEAYMWRLVKAADKLSALLKCMEEENAGNREFDTAKISTRESIDRMAAELPEVEDFIRDFLDSYGNTLDQLLEE